ncbi:MAG TPA: arsenate reductase ArsC [Gemmatimonadaceae bacterium]
MKMSDRGSDLSVLFLCTRNSARSQIAEAIINHKAAGRIRAASAGSQPGSEVHPLAVDALRARGIEWQGRTPKDFEAVSDEHWDVIITVCDQAREACPTFPGQPVYAHWGIPDPAAATGADADRKRAFSEAAVFLARRIDLLLALPLEKLSRRALQDQVEDIASALPWERDNSARSRAVFPKFTKV